MKKTILIYGSIAGFIVTLMMVYGTYSFCNNPDFKPSEVFGYASMLIAFTFVFIGIKNFRDKQNLGVITFGKAFKIGALISLVASTFYVGVWLLEYYVFFPDFMEKYAATVIKNLQADGATQAVIDAKNNEMQMFKEWYKSPIMVILLTYAEILPLGLVIALLSALILKRKEKTV